MRQVVAPLMMARRLQSRPSGIPVGRPRGVKALGVKYEGLVARHMPWAQQGVWFEFADRLGSAVCQPDLIWFQGDYVVVAEVKHTWVEEAEVKLRLLYMPVVAKATQRVVLGLVICKNLVPGIQACYGQLQPALVFAQHSMAKLPTFHWLGKSTIQEPFLVVPRTARLAS